MNDMMRDASEQAARGIGLLTPRVAIAAFVVIVAVVLNHMIHRGFQRRHAFVQLPGYGQALILNAATTATALAVGTAILTVWGMTWSSIAAGIGVSTLAIARGMLDVLKSLAGGVAIMLERPCPSKSTSDYPRELNIRSKHALHRAVVSWQSDVRVSRSHT